MCIACGTAPHEAGTTKQAVDAERDPPCRLWQADAELLRGGLDLLVMAACLVIFLALLEELLIDNRVMVLFFGQPPYLRS